MLRALCLAVQADWATSVTQTELSGLRSQIPAWLDWIHSPNATGSHTPQGISKFYVRLCSILFFSRRNVAHRPWKQYSRILDQRSATHAMVLRKVTTKSSSDTCKGRSWGAQHLNSCLWKMVTQFLCFSMALLWVETSHRDSMFILESIRSELLSFWTDLHLHR